MNNKLTQAKRLSQQFDTMRQLGPSLIAPSLIQASLSSEGFRSAWYAARHCLSEIQKAYEEAPNFSDRTRSAMQHPINRLRASLSDTAFLMNFNTYSAHHLGTRLSEDLDAIDASLSDHQIFELFAASDVAALSKDVAKLKDKILKSSLDDRLKRKMHALLVRMQGVFETYDLLGERDLETIVGLWAASIIQFHEEFKASEDTELKSGIMGLLQKCWQGTKFIKEAIDTTKPIFEMLAPVAESISDTIN